MPTYTSLSQRWGFYCPSCSKHYELSPAIAPLSSHRTFGRGTACLFQCWISRTPFSSKLVQSASQGSLISAAINPTFSPRGSPESPQFQTLTEADLLLSPWPRAHSEAGNFEAHSQLGNLHFLFPDRQAPSQVKPPCPLRLALAAFSALPKILSPDCCIDGSSSDDDLPNVIHAYTSVEMFSRNKQPMLPGNNEDLTRVWWRAEHNFLSCSEDRKLPDSAR